MLRERTTVGPTESTRVTLETTFDHLPSRERMEDNARALAAKDGITDGLVCVYGINETCRTFRVRYGDDMSGRTQEWPSNSDWKPRPEDVEYFSRNPRA